jgi:GNAT superfamily N-acetyltransferase
MLHDVTVADPGLDSAEIEALLRDVYVGEGFTDAAAAGALFAAPAVLERGRVLVARDRASGALSGMVIVVPPTSLACRFARVGETEMHLLAVAPPFRRTGVGGALVSAALEAARGDGAARMILWTQPAMTSAQRLYERSGFERVTARDFERSGRKFIVFERALEGADLASRISAGSR